MSEKLESETPSDVAACSASLDVWDTLMIRACKINRPSLGRFRRIMARRCGLRLEHVEDRFVADYLLEIVERLGLKTLRNFVWEMNPTELWKCGAPRGCEVDANGVPHRHREKVITLAASILRLTAVKKLPGLRSPSRFERRRQNSELSHPAATIQSDEA